MLLQTFVQLHILLAATPGLVGWPVLMPVTQALPAHVLYLAARGTVELPRYDAPAQHPFQRQRISSGSDPRRRNAALILGPTSQSSFFVSAAPMPLSENDQSFPNAPRAP